MMQTAAALSGAILLAASAAAQESVASFDPRRYQADVHGELTGIYVLATPHLGQDERYAGADLATLLDRLESFAPDVITIEALPGEVIHLMTAYEGVYGDSVGHFAGAALRAAGLASEALGLSMHEAEAEVRRALDARSATPSPGDRRRLAALFAASGDPYSALVQWLHLPDEERNEGDGINAGLAALLDNLAVSRNENVRIAAALAVRLGHDRLWPVDDQTAVDLMDRVAGPMTEALGSPEYADIMEHPVFTSQDVREEELADPQGVLDHYRRLNAPAFGHMDAEGQWRVMIDRAWPQNAGRIRMAEWETRNLRMAAHVRRAAAESVEGRVLVIVGASHKPWLDAYLGVMSDMRILSTDAILE